jgi:hypothetical protein
VWPCVALRLTTAWDLRVLLFAFCCPDHFRVERYGGQQYFGTFGMWEGDQIVRKWNRGEANCGSGRIFG